MIKLVGMGLTGLALSAMMLPIAAEAQAPATTPTTANASCVALREVTTGKAEVRKQVKNSIFGSTGVFTSSNWNTDFVVPTGRSFSYFVGIMEPENDATYDISVHLKYPDRTSSMVFQRNMPMRRMQVYSLPFTSPTGVQPFQINARVGGENNTAYRLAILACE